MSNQQVQKATHTGLLKIGRLEIPCAVLEDGTRVITQRGMFVALGMHKNPSKGQIAIADKPGFLAASNLIPFIPEDLIRSWTPIQFRLPKGSGGYKGNIAFGYRAEILPQVCHVYLDAKESGKLTERQDHIFKAAKLLQRGFAIIGIVALVDEATGYQEIRDRLALQKILDKYLTDEWAKWTKTFPDEFYKELFRLKGISYPPIQGKSKRPSYVGHWTNDIIYTRLAPGVLQALREMDPRLPTTGERARRFHQHLTRDFGHPSLRDLLSNVIFLMRGCSTWQDFKRLLERAAPKYGDTIPMSLEDKIE